MTWNEFVNYVQLEIDKVTNKDPQVENIYVTLPSNDPRRVPIITINKNQLTISQ